MNNTYSSNLNSINNLPTPLNLSYFWNLGSLLALIIIIQVITGILLSLIYNPTQIEAFDSIIYLIRESKFGFSVRFIHINGASLVFIFIFLHIFNSLLFSTFSFNLNSWISGILILLFTMVTAFIGYILPWGNIGFWAATVITSFISTIPSIGINILSWIWGNFSVCENTLQFFFTLHFLTPFLILSLLIVHILFLHNNGSFSILGSNASFLNINFLPFFSSNDLINIIIYLLFSLFTLYCPYWSSDPENFSNADPLSSPININPEWYFLPFYGFLRSSESNLGGLTTMILGIVILLFLPYNTLFPLNNWLYWTFNMTLLLSSLLATGWISSWSADSFPSFYLKTFTLLYFFSFLIIWLFFIITNNSF